MGEGFFIGNRIIRLNEVNSTNDYLKSYIAENKMPHEGLVVLTDNQTSGRGQQGNTWLSEPGKNLCFSVLIVPKLDLNKQFLISQLTSLALIDVLMDLGLENCSIKWPNDIYIGGKKVAGMLIENTVKGNVVTNSILGIGLNVNQTEFDASLPNPTSIAMEKQCQTVELNKVLELFFRRFQGRYLSLRVNDKAHELCSEYMSHLFQKEQEKPYLVRGEEKLAIIRGVSTEGYLLLEIDQEVDSFDFKEVTYLY